MTSNDDIAWQIARQLWRDNTSPEYLAFLAQKLSPGSLNSQIDDPFRRVILRDGQGNRVQPFLVTRRVYVDEIAATLAHPVNIAICGRPGAGKSTFHENAAALCSKAPADLIVKWGFVCEAGTPQEFAHFKRSELAYRIFDEYWEALCRPEVPHPYVPAEFSNSWWASRLLWFHRHQKFHPPDGSGRRQPSSDPEIAALLEQEADDALLGDVLEEMLNLATSSEDMQLSSLSRAETSQAKLRSQISEKLSLDELKVLCFDLGVEYDDLSGQTQAVKVISLLKHVRAHAMEARLERELHDKFPEVGWEKLRPPAASPHHAGWKPYERIRVFVDGIDKLAPEIQSQLIAEALALSIAYPELYFTLSTTGIPTDCDSALCRPIILEQWSDQQLDELLALRVAVAANCAVEPGLDWPTVLHLDQELAPATKRNLSKTIVKGARRAYDFEDLFSDLEDAPVHALRLARGVLSACALRRGDQGGSSEIQKLEPEEVETLIAAYWQQRPQHVRSLPPRFQGRKKEIAAVCEKKGGPSCVVNFCGEPGIGKTRVLAQIAAELRSRSGRARVAYLDLSPLKSIDPVLRRDQLLKALIEATDGFVSGLEAVASNEVAAVVARLCSLDDPAPVLLFDTTEAVHDDVAFQDWLEKNMVGPLVGDSRVCMVFAGRVRVPWRTFSVRTAAKEFLLLPLDAQQSDDPAQHLVRDVLSHSALFGPAPGLERTVAAILALSGGHPELSRRLADWAAVDEHRNLRPGISLRRRMARDVVKPFVDRVLFEDVEPEWQGILWQASVLAWFDSTTLRDYLKGIGLGVSSDKWDADFIRQIDHLRRQVAAVTWVEGGYRLNGTLRDIVRRCFELTDRPGYHKAIAAAIALWEELVNEPDLDAGTKLRYQGELEDYRRFAGQEQSR